MDIKANPLLSICISSFNKGERCINLVNSLLELEENRFNIIICDDCSDEATIKVLRTIKSERVKVFQNDNNIGACANWYETINLGNGEYLLHVLDRDYIEVRLLKTLLDYLEVNDIGVGYIGNYPVCKSNQFFLKYRAGEKTVSEIGGIPIHPTGFIIKNSEWDSDKFRKFFYNDQTFSIYPHSYIIGIVGLKRDVLIVRTNFCRFVYSQSNKSLFYTKKTKNDYWWEPRAVLDTCLKMTIHMYDYFSMEDHRNAFVVNVFKHSVMRGTIYYREAVMDKRLMAHYSCKVKNITLSALFVYNCVFTIKYATFLKKFKTYNFKTFFSVLKIAKENYSNILKCY